MLEKVIAVDHIEVTRNKNVQVRTKITIMEYGKEISSNFHRHVVVPGADYSAEDASVQAICAVTHTADVVAAYQAEQARIDVERAALAQPK